MKLMHNMKITWKYFTIKHGKGVVDGKAWSMEKAFGLVFYNE